jgi:3-oxoacyl-[acyl-carrier protein] reductase
LDILRIRVNCVELGAFITDMTAMIPEEMKKQQAERFPLKRMGQPEEAANTILFLASNEASYITATSILVDGGHLAV